MQNIINTLKKIARLLPSKYFLYLKFITTHKYIPHLKNWRSFSEYLNYIKLYDSNEMRRVFCDRIAVREYVKITAPEVSLTKIFWIGNNFTKEIWDRMPEKFVLKGTHGSRMVSLINKNKDSFEEIASKSKKWLETDFSKCQKEWFYDGIPKVLICEEMLGDGINPPPDFKFFVIKGKVEMIQVNVRNNGGHNLSLYSPDLEPLPVKMVYPVVGPIKKPRLLEQAIKISEKISGDMLFLRIDLYILEDKVYFGEITNIPGAGVEVFSPSSFDFEFGRKIKNHTK